MQLFPCVLHPTSRHPKAAFTAQSRVAQAGVPSRVCCCSRETDVAGGCEQHHRADKTWALPPSVTVRSRTTVSKTQHHQLGIPAAEAESSYLSAPQMRAVQPCYRDGPSSLSTEQEPQSMSSSQRLGLSPICSVTPNYYSIHVCQFSLAYQWICLQVFPQQESATARP